MSIKKVEYNGKQYIIAVYNLSGGNRKTCLVCGYNNVITKHHVERRRDKTHKIPICPNCHVLINKGVIKIIEYSLDEWNREIIKQGDLTKISDCQEEYPTNQR